MIAKSKHNLQLLLTLGYSPQWLSNTVAKKWIPVYIAIIASALLTTALLQYFFQQSFLKGRDDLSPIVHWIVIAIAVLLAILCAAINHRLIKRLLYKL